MSRRGEMITIELGRAGNYEIFIANTGLGKARTGSQFSAAGDGGYVPHIIEAAGTLLQEGSPENPEPMGSGFEVSACAQTDLHRLVEQSGRRRVALLGRVTLLS